MPRLAPTARHADPLEVHLLGIVDYDAALYLQERLVYEFSGRDDRSGSLLICEHPPIVTIGREGSRAHLRVEDREFLARQMEVRWTNRGGGCLVHCPGQLAIYPVVPLERLGIRPSEYIGRLTEAVIDLCTELRVPAWPCEDGRGVACRLGRFTAMGAAVKSDVTYHGMFINVAPPMDLIRLVDSGPRGERQTSLAAQRGRATEMHTVREGLIRHLSAVLGYSRHHLYTGHPLLKRTRRKIALSA
jgi:lipoyl(octanoyl) transferase